MFTAFVTISGESPDTTWDYLDVVFRREFESFDDARRCYEGLYVKPWGAIAHSLHALYPDLVQIEAEYDIYEDGEPVGDLDWFVNEAIWWKES